GADPTKINCIGNLTGRLADVVLANTHRWILATSAIRHIKLIPGNSVVRRDGNAVGADRGGRAAGRIRYVGGPLRRYLDVSMYTAEALRRIEKRNSWSKGLAAIIAARAFCFGQTLRAVVNCVWIGRSRWRRHRRMVGTAADSLMIRPLARTAVSARQIGVAVVVRNRSHAIAGSQVDEKQSAGS